MTIPACDPLNAFLKKLFHKCKRLLTKPAWFNPCWGLLRWQQHNSFLNPNPQTSTAAFAFVGPFIRYLCCLRSSACGVRSMQKAHTSPRGWLQPCAGDRLCRAAGSPEGIRYCSEVSPQRWQHCPRLSCRKACMLTTDRGSAWRAAAARLFGYRWNFGWLDLTPVYAKALRKHREIRYKPDSQVTDSNFKNMLAPKFHIYLTTRRSRAWVQHTSRKTHWQISSWHLPCTHNLLAF